MRGTAQYYDVTNLQIRITPACAGNSKSATLTDFLPSDHPRVCGEQALGGEWRAEFVGSPPRVRGTARIRYNPHPVPRITPACAGNRFLLLPAGIVAWDHPRVCGEQVFLRLLKGLDMGSPPRVRGTVIVQILSGHHERITPACAGNRN